jgi:transcriptional regulator with XRE-family HTH domain
LEEEQKANVFGRWLGSTLRASRMSASELNQRAKISRAAVYHYLSGKRLPDDDSLGRIVKALGVEGSVIPVFERRKVGRPSRIEGK